MSIYKLESERVRVLVFHNVTTKGGHLFKRMKRNSSNKDCLPFTCPVCGRKTNYPVSELVPGAVLTCSFCKLVLTLHGHMLEEVQREIRKRREGA